MVLNDFFQPTFRVNASPSIMRILIQAGLNDRRETVSMKADKLHLIHKVDGRDI
ncbi:MAG: hypothetical protein ACFFBD_10195 [Candidatus Hodarchaeota archaeon]